MNKAAIQKTARNAMKTISKHSPTIMTCVGVVSIVSTAILAVMATPKAVKAIEENKEELDELAESNISEAEYDARAREIRKDTCKQLVKYYWKPAANAVVGITAVIFANRVQHKRNLALASAYALSIKELADWKETARELKLLNKNSEQKIKDKLVEKKVKKAKENPEQQVIFTGRGEDWFIDDWSGQVFKSSTVEVERCVNDWNSKLLREDQVTLNDLYYLLGIREVPAGDLGFEASHGIVGVEFGSSLVDGRAYVTLGFDREPMLL